MMLVLAILLLVVPCMASALAIRYDVMQVHNGVRARTAVAVAVYKHSLKLTSAARQGVSSGEVVNLFSNDALKVRARPRDRVRATNVGTRTSTNPNPTPEPPHLNPNPNPKPNPEHSIILSLTLSP